MGQGLSLALPDSRVQVLVMTKEEKWSQDQAQSNRKKVDGGKKN